jgi:hypothetical protein
MDLEENAEEIFQRIEELEENCRVLDGLLNKIKHLPSIDIPDDNIQSLRSQVSQISHGGEKLKKFLEAHLDDDSAKALIGLREFEAKREETEQKPLESLERLKTLAETYKENKQPQQTPKYDDVIGAIEHIENNEHVLREFESQLEKDLFRNIENRALERAKEIINKERPVVVFEPQPLEEFVEFCYEEQYEEGLEGAGYFNYEKEETEQNVRYVIKSFNSYREEMYSSRGENSLYTEGKEEFKKWIRENNKIFCHTHPPDHEKTHSEFDSLNGEVGILGVPRNENKIWVIPQIWRGGDYRNVKISVRGDIKKSIKEKLRIREYNKAIIKAAAFGKMSREIRLNRRLIENYGSWTVEGVREARGRDLSILSEKNWLRFTEEEQY